MKIEESKSLHYDKIPWVFFNGYEKFGPKNCLLESFNREAGRLTLYFKNGSCAVVKAKNSTGEMEMNLIVDKVKDLIGKSYEEILNTNF